MFSISFLVLTNTVITENEECVITLVKEGKIKNEENQDPTCSKLGIIFISITFSLDPCNCERRIYSS